MDTKFQMDDEGNHRIIVDGVKSGWAGYQNVSRLEHNGKWYIGVTMYYEGHLPFECVLEATQLPSTSELITGRMPE